MSSPFPPDTNLPHHLAIIPDGNRRWAKEHKLPIIQGHLKGFEALLKIAKAAREWGIHTVTIWIFSTENWKRERQEVDYLMKIEEDMIKKYLPELKKDKVRIIHLGRKDRIPKSFAETLKRAETETQKNPAHILNIAVDYGGRDEIIRAIFRYENAKIENQNQTSPIPPPIRRGFTLSGSEGLGRGLNLTEDNFENFLDTAHQPYPNPDLLIRTSGEMRTSGLLPWQMAYTEFVFIAKHLPDCTTDDLKEAILEYSKRQRRFGGN